MRKSKKLDQPATKNSIPLSKQIFLTACGRPSRGPRKKILNPPSCNQNLCSLDLHRKQKDVILDSPCVPHPCIKQIRNQDEISAGPKQHILLQVTITHHPTIKALQTTKITKLCPFSPH